MNTHRDKSPDEIERDITATRDHIDRTLDVLTERLSPSGLLDQAIHTARDTGGEFTLNLGRTIRDNPVPAALLGLGLGWLMVADRRHKDGRNGYTRADTGGHAWGGDGHDLAESDGGDGSYRRRVEGTATASPASSIEGRPADGPEDWSAAYEAQPREWPEGSEATETGSSARAAEDKARDAFARGRSDASAMRSSLAERTRRGSDQAHDTADRARRSAGDTAEHLRASGRDTAARTRMSARNAADRVRAGGRNTGDRLRESGQRFSERFDEGRRGLADSAGAAMARGRDYGAATGERASEMYRRSGYAVRSAGYRARDAAGSAGSFAREHPLAVGLVLAAAGAALAGLTPRSRREDEWMGERSDEFKDAAREAAHAEVDRAREAASAAMRTGSEELQRSGLTAGDAKRAADEKVAAGIGAASSAAKAGADTLEQRDQKSGSNASGRQSAEDALGADTADKIRPEPSADRSESEAKPAGVGGVSGISTPAVAGGGAGSTVETRSAEPDKQTDVAAGQSGHDRT